MSVFIPTPRFPDVPFASGVPVVARAVGGLVGLGSVAALVSDFIGLFSGDSEWGIFDEGGESVVPHDDVVAFDFQQQYSISDYPVERGGFQSYNKVAVPYDVRFRFTSSGSQAIRTDFLSTLQGAAGSIEVYTAATPDATYESCNIIHYDYHREARNGGVSLLVVDVWLREIRETGETQLAQSGVSDTSQSQIDGGTKQATETTLKGGQAQGAPALTEHTVKVNEPLVDGGNYRSDIPQYTHIQDPGLPSFSGGASPPPAVLNGVSLEPRLPSFSGGASGSPEIIEGP